MKKALIDLTPIQVGALRIIFSSLTLFLVGFKSLFTISAKQWFHIFITSMVGTFFPVFFFAYALQHIDSSIVAILNSLTPLNALVVGTVFYGFYFIRKQTFGIIIGLIGALLLIIKGAEINPDQNYYYAILIVISSVGYAFNVNIIKKHLNDLNALTITTGNFVLLILPAFVILYFTDFFHVEKIESSTNALWYILVLSIIGTALAKTLFNRLVQISSPIFSSSVTYLIPFVAIFWGVLDGEKLHISQVFYGSLVLLGIYLINKSK
jgi:drug/metabolite transporter (DMT)-like permease